MAEKRVPRRRAAKKKPTERAIMAVVRKLVDPDTGEIYPCFVPAYQLDRLALRQREVRTNDLVLIDVFKDRNPRFWRLFHALSGFLADNVDELNGLKHHDALKKVQRDSRIHCELVDVFADDGAKVGQIVQACSLSFDNTDETLAAEIWDQLCDYVARTYFPGWDDEQVKAAAAMWEKQQ